MKKLFIVFINTLLIFTLFTGCPESSSKNSKNSPFNSQSQVPIPKQEKPVNNETYTPQILFSTTNLIIDTNKKTFNDVDIFDTVAAMTTGWNLGNTLDATGTTKLDSETSWGQPLTTKEMIDSLAASGIKTIRIPVSWHNHIINKNEYKIDPEWMARVKTIVDWAIEDNLYVIINAHHDNGNNQYQMAKASGYYPNNTNLVESQRYLYNIWSQIALAFNNGYDEHLIFETMNEPRPAGTECEWNFNNDARCLESANCLNQMNQTALDAIRTSGGNNQKRFVMCPALQASLNSAISQTFKMPKDDEKGKLILSIHAYTPYSFAMESPGDITFTDQHKKDLNYLFTQLKTNFINKGYPIIIGEYGATNKDNLEERVKWFDYFLSSAHSLGITCILWDNGVWALKNDDSGNPDYNEGYGFYNRTNQTWYFPKILETIINTTKD